MTMTHFLVVLYTIQANTMQIFNITQARGIYKKSDRLPLGFDVKYIQQIGLTRGKIKHMGVIFVAGTYGVGKSTLCNKLSTALKIPDFSAGDLISVVNGETYGANKAVRDKDANQNILASQVKQLLKSTPRIILAGHFCIFDINGNVDTLPSSVFYDLEIETIILLEASSSQIIKNLSVRDKKEYSESQILLLQKAEHEKAHEIATSINCNLYVHHMLFDETDITSCLSYIDIERGQKL